ncbi:MAG: hypothetical protein WCA39_18045, partial [Nitrososphaeraceae archaeon]
GNLHTTICARDAIISGIAYSNGLKQSLFQNLPAIALAIGIASASIIGGGYVFVKLKPQMRNWHVFTQLSFYSSMVLLKLSAPSRLTLPC